MPIVCAAATSAIALTDAVVQGITGHSVLPGDNAPVTLAVDAVHGITYAALCWVLAVPGTPDRCREAGYAAGYAGC